ncbi:hypothetical protein [Acinetobacter pittii]|uniref:hypothetical protein n=1 Tax=Acinetobacter pittii TaxID=48296 RepID=UPI0005C749E7|nr:hypothetical protein [Acinetobacter pittii]
MELSTIEKNTEAQDIQSDAYDQRVHSVLIVPEHALKKIESMILATGHVQSDSTNLLEVLRPMPEEFRKDVDNTEFTEKENGDIGDAAVVIVDGLIHDTKRGVWISQNWGCGSPKFTKLIQAGAEPPIELIAKNKGDKFSATLTHEFQKAYERMGYTQKQVGYIHILSNGTPTTFFNYLSDELLCKLEFISVDNNRLNASQTNFHSAVERGSVSDWGVSYHRKPFNLENYPINSLLVSGLTITFILYLIYSYLFGA